MILGLCGLAGSGKSTCADEAERRGFVRVSLADPLKDLVARAFELRPEQVRGTQEEKAAIDPRWNLSGRDLCVRVGQGAREELGEAVWLRAFVRRARRVLAEGKNVVCDDVRYENEVRAILETGGLVVKLSCPGPAVVSLATPSERSVLDIPRRLFSWEIQSPRSPGAEDLLRRFREFLDNTGLAL